MKPVVIKLGGKGYPQHWVAIVGSRKSTPYGLDVTRQVSSELAKRGVVVVSGLALGIDSAAHKGTLEARGKTVGVLGGGFNQLYPQTNRSLARSIIDAGGALISEYEPDTPPLRQQFPARNRIIAGLCQITIVVEAALSSGSLITASFALEEGRDVMAVPGNINQPGSQGCNQLIKVGAQPLTGVNDVLTLLDLDPEPTGVQKEFDDETEKRLYTLISSGIEDVDELTAKIKLEPSAASRYLTTLELKGYIVSKGAGQVCFSATCPTRFSI